MQRRAIEPTCPIRKIRIANRHFGLDHSQKTFLGLEPRNGSWTDKRVHFFGVPARREETACLLPATTNLRPNISLWGVKKVCNLVRSKSHLLGEA
jgi:hypothetical protein